MDIKTPPKPIMKNTTKKKLADYFKMNKKDETALLIFLVLLLCSALGYFVFLPAAGNYHDGRVQNINLAREKETLQQKQDNLQGLKKDLTDRSDFIAKTIDAMPTEPQVPELLVTLSKLTSDNSLYMTNFAPKETPANTGAGAEGQTAVPAVEQYSKVEFEFDVSGNYLNMKQFIKDVEANIRPINIININISGGGEISKETSTEVLRFHVKAETYYKGKQ